MARSRTCRQCGRKGIIDSGAEGKDDFHRTKVYKGKVYYRGVCKDCYSPKAKMTENGERERVVETVQSEEHKYVKEDFARALIDLSRHSMDRLQAITQKEFERKTKAAKFLRKSGVSYLEVMESATALLKTMGYDHPVEAEYDEGLYLVVGDSHGKHTKRNMFKLLNSLNKNLKIDRIIHVGHMLDDDNDVSYLWDDFDNLTILSKPEELKYVNRYNQNLGDIHEIVRGTIKLGDLTVVNQELVTDYVRTNLQAVNSNIFPGKTVCNLHRPERTPRCSSDGINFIASPGCLCEPHIVRTIKQIDFTDGYQVKQAYPDSFIKYRRAAQLSKVWDQGLILVKVDSNGVAFVLQCPIQTVDTDKVTVVFDKVFHNDRKVTEPDRKIFVVGDTHVPDFDIHVLDVQNQIAQKFQAEHLVDLGDLATMAGVNHHTMGRREIREYANASLVKEASLAHWVLKQRLEYSDYKTATLLYANHERFSEDFIKKNPQFAELLNIRTLLGVDDAGYSLVPHKVPLKVGAFTFVHGDMDLYGESGKVYDKLSRAFDIGQGRALVFGHVHSAGIRSRTYSVGMSGTMNQMYNETSATYWTQGCSLCCEYEGKAFTQLIDIIDGRAWYGDNILSGLSPSIKFPAVGTFSIKYTFEGR